MAFNEIDKYIQENENITIADIFRKIREINGLSQRDLAKEIKVNNAVISRIESGITTKPDFRTLIKIALTFEIKDRYLFLKSANYTDEECEKLGYKKEIAYTELLGFDLAKSGKYICKDTKRPDIIAMLEDFKNGNINMQEIVALLFLTTKVDLRRYISEEDKDKYNLHNFLVNHKRK